ncbi:mitochondrial amidoxime reducing component 2-like isoform X1 [Varroa jacobsoni]|uniref:mitochondrial amidoxime reducing component 2-like isoform X1 n=2 Tax=Varroa jacobsoni TaxID=62625 RepID=UPI000BF8F36F|nr:mitochondrial amidoxime reducing component 2-like isoform X1 [Varroa jacobsoni]
MVPKLSASIPSSAVVIGLGTVATVAASYAVYQHVVNRAKFKKLGTVKRLFIYPIKSLPPIELTRAYVTVHGMTYKDLRDREFMLINPMDGNKSVSAREEPRLLLLHVNYNEEAKCLEITSKDPMVPTGTLVLSLEPVTVDWNSPDQLDIFIRKPEHAYKCLPIAEASAWFSKYLGKDFKFVRFLRQTVKRRKEIPDRFYDLAELNILSEKSVENLNELICDPSTDVSYRNFRPNILLDVNMPFEEDYWAIMKIGDLETEFLQRCVRCVLITINPDTGVKTDKEPLTTLRKYRIDRSEEGIAKYRRQPLFSANHVIRRPGKIYVGQSIEAIRAPREML